MTRRWTSRDVTDLSVKVAELVPEALARAQKDCHGGFKSGHGDGRGTRNGDGTPGSKPQSLAFSGAVSEDPVPKALRRLIDGLVQARGAVQELLAADPADVRLVFQAPGAGWCVNCGRYCAGKGSDRLRSGRCDPCRKHRERTGEDRRIEQEKEAG